MSNASALSQPRLHPQNGLKPWASHRVGICRRGHLINNATLFGRSGVLCFVLLAMTLPAFANLQNGEIFNVQVTNVQQTQVTFTWQSVHPSSSYVYINFWNPGGFLPTRKLGQNDSTTSHSVTVFSLVPFNPQAGNGDVGQYAYYVASQRTDDKTWASYGGPQTNAYGTVLTFRTAPLDSFAPLNVAMTPLGQKNVYPGHDLYMMPTLTLLAGGAGSQQGSILLMTSYQVRDGNNNPVNWVVDLLDRVRSYPGGYNPGSAWDGEIYVQGGGPQFGKQYVWGGAQANWATATQMNGDKGAIRVRVPATAKAGSYTLSLTLQLFNDDGANIPVGAPINVTWPFTVYPPAQFTPTPPSVFPPIPSLAIWQVDMSSAYIGGGVYWCTGASAASPVASLEYGTFLGPTFSLEGNFDANSQPSALQQYNYDGGKVFLQIGDYTYNTPGMLGYHDRIVKAQWDHCAQMVLYPYDNWLSLSHGEFINEPNQILMGTGMYYARTGDPVAKSALSFATDTNGPFSGFYGSLDTRDIRIISYSWDSQIANEASGLKGRWQLADMAIDVALANLDMFQQFAVSQGESVQPEVNYHNFQLGLLLEALIDQCEIDEELRHDCDPRIPLEVGKTLYALFNNFYFSDSATTPYNFLDVPTPHVYNDQNSTAAWSNLNELISPAAAWYWSLTGDETIRGYADAMFKSTWKDTSNLTWGAKQFNQVYKWSFDFVRYRSGPNPKATFLPSQNPYQGLAYTLYPLIINQYKCGIGNETLCQNSNIPAPVVNGTTVTLTWDTIEPSTTEVYYTTGVPKSCPFSARHYAISLFACVGQYDGHYLADPLGALHHVAVVSGLSPGTLYHYRRFAGRSASFSAMTNDATFTTQ